MEVCVCVCGGWHTVHFLGQSGLLVPTCRRSGCQGFLPPSITPTPSALGPSPSWGTVVGEKGRDSWNHYRPFSKAAHGREVEGGIRQDLLCWAIVMLQPQPLAWKP